MKNKMVIFLLLVILGLFVVINRQSKLLSEASLAVVDATDSLSQANDYFTEVNEVVSKCKQLLRENENATIRLL